MKFKITYLAMIVLLAMLLTACQGKDDPGIVLFSDDFSNNTSGWDQEAASSEYAGVREHSSYVPGRLFCRQAEQATAELACPRVAVS